jgi:hypothetical protein
MEPLSLQIRTWEDPECIKTMKAQQLKVNNTESTDKRKEKETPMQTSVWTERQTRTAIAGAW